jgi:sugar-phosphatase
MQFDQQLVLRYDQNMAAIPTNHLVFAAALFDLDGTLVDSTALVELEWRLWAKAKGLDAEAVIRSAHGRPTEDVIREYLPNRILAVEFSEFLSVAAGLDQNSVQPVLGAIDFVKSLRTDRWAVVTSAPRHIAAKRLSMCAFPVPPVLVCADEVINGKPDPEGYLLAARDLGQDPRNCVAFEDTPAGASAAQLAEVRTVALSTTYPEEAFSGCLRIQDFRSLKVLLREDGLMELLVYP